MHRRGYTPVDPNPEADTVDIEFALHDVVASRWAQDAQPTDTIELTVLGIDKTQPVVFSADETTDVGRETGTTVRPDYTAHTSKFTGRINWVRIDLGEDATDADHCLDPEERFRIAMARQ